MTLTHAGTRWNAVRYEAQWRGRKVVRQLSVHELALRACMGAFALACGGQAEAGDMPGKHEAIIPPGYPSGGAVTAGGGASATASGGAGADRTGPRFAAGGLSVTAISGASAAGGYASAAGGYASAAGGYASAAGGYASAAGGHASAAGGHASAAGGHASATAGYAGATAGYAGATAAAGNGAGGASSCVPVCSLYGAPCCLWASSCLGPMGSCQLDLLNTTVGTTYEYVELEQKLAAVAATVLLTVSDADVSWAGADPSPAARIELQLSEEASLRLGNALEAARDNAFSFSCNGQRLFVGVGYLWYGAAALKTPVLHVERTAAGQIILRLGAWQGSWMGFTADAAARQRLDQITLRGVLCRRGLMHELDPEGRPSTP